MRALVCIALLVLAAAGCGGERQDADEPEGEFTLEIVEASFPERQSIAERSTLSLEVRNTDDRELPNLAVTIETEPDDGGEAGVAFARAADDERLADDARPVWVLDRGPEGGTSAYTNTWALGPMFPGQTETFEWRLTAVQAGDYTINYRISPGLDGKAVPADGQRTTGSFEVTISDEPVPARVNEEGEVVRGDEAGGPGVGD
ncbi:MAG: hypothetical protein ACRDPC_13660 [Solirubrobacteraceae bacterium]